MRLCELNDLSRCRAVGYFQNSDRPRLIVEIVRQRCTARIDDERTAVSHDAFAVAVSLHDHVPRAAEVTMHRVQKNLLRSFIGRRDRMYQADPHALNLELMRLAHTLIDFELMLV